MDIQKPLSELLVWLAGPAGALAWAVITSNFVRNLKGDNKLAGWQSWHIQLFILALTASLPVGAYVAVRYIPAETVAALEPLWQLLSVLALAYLAQQDWYKRLKAAG